MYMLKNIVEIGALGETNVSSIGTVILGKVFLVYRSILAMVLMN
jgi:hypothetical protein